MILKDDKYYIDNIEVTGLCHKYGTPLYVYDMSKISEQFSKMQNAFAYKNLRVNYACKALSNINILKYLNKLGAGLDTVSIQEVYLGLMAGFNPKDIIYTPNCVSIEEYEMAVEAGVRINIDNLSILEQFGIKYGSRIPVCVRINPHIMAGGNEKISVGHIDSKFGISIHQLPHLLRIINTNGIVVEGLHMHTGSDILDIEVFLQGTSLLLETARNFKSLEYIDFGSGFKVPYKPDDYFTDIVLLGEEMSVQFSDFCKEYGKELTLMFEPGKFLVSQAGYFFAHVNVIKHTTSTVFAGIDSGLNHLIRPMFYDAYHHIANVSKPSGRQRIYTVVGYICETDTFGWNRRIAEISEGDILGFYNAGAYCYSMASNYNSRFRPAEVMIHNKKDYMISKRESMDDLTKNQIILPFEEIMV